MEVLPPIFYHSSNMSWFLEHGRAERWTPAENKMFEYALAVHDEDTPDRWHKVAAEIPGKKMEDVMLHYRELELDVGKIEAGLIPTPGHTAPPPFTLEVGRHLYDEFKRSYSFGIGRGKRSASTRPHEQERKKGVPWTEEEHKLFLKGLKKYGKGDWRNISRNFVVTRTPTQVASHAQKYYIRQLSGGKDKRRASIHDITTVNISETRSPSPDDRQHPSPDRSTSATLVQQPIPALATSFIWNQPGNGEIMAFTTTHRNMCLSPPPIGNGTIGVKAEPKIHYDSLDYENFTEMQNPVCQMQSGDCYYWPSFAPNTLDAPPF